MARSSWLGEMDDIRVRRHFVFTLSLLAIVVACAGPLSAASRSFDRTDPDCEDGLFSDSGCWSQVPVAGDTLVIKGACIYDAAAANLEYGNLNLGQGNIDGSISWNSGNTLNVAAISSADPDSFISMVGATSGATLQVRTSWSPTNLTFDAGTVGTVHWNVTGAASTLPAYDFANLTIDASGQTVSASTSFNLTGTLNVDEGTFSPGAATVINSVTPQGVLTGTGTVRVTRATGTNDFSTQYRMSAYTLGSLIVDYSGSGADVDDLSYAALTISGSITAATTSSVSGTLTVTGTFTPSGGTMTQSGGSIVNSGSLTFATLAISGAVSSNSSFAVGTALSVTGSFSPTGAVTMNASSSISNSGTLSFTDLTAGAGVTTASDFTITGVLIVSGGLTASGGTITQSGGSIVNNGLLIFNALTIANTVTTSSGFQVNTALTVNGTFTPSGGTIVVMNGGSIANTGTLTFSTLSIPAAATVTTASSFAIGSMLSIGSGAALTASAGTITFDNGAALSPGASGTANFVDVTIASGGSVAFDAGQTINVSGTLTIDGTLVPAALAVIGGGGGLTGTGVQRITRATNTDDYNGQYALLGTHTLTNLTTEFAGASAQGLSTNQSYGALKINNAAGVSFSSSDVTTGTLELTAGNVNPNANVLIVTTQSAAAVTRTSGHVLGVLRRSLDDDAGSYLFPVGTATIYAPALLTFASGTTGTMDVSTADGDHASLATSGLDSEASVDRTWTLAGLTGRSYDATFTFDATDVDDGAVTSAFVVRRFDAGNWNSTATGARTATSTQATTLSQVGSFAIGQQALDHFSVSTGSTHVVGEIFAIMVTAQDLLSQTVPSTLLVTMTSTGAVAYDGDDDETFDNNTKNLIGGAFVIDARDFTPESVLLTATAGSITGSVAITITQAETTTSVTSNTPTVFGQSASLDAFVEVEEPGVGTPTGMVAFDDDGTPIAGCTSVSLVAGHAICATTALSVASHTINATYAGSTQYAGSTGAGTHVVGIADSTTGLTSSLNPSAVGQSVNFTATVFANSPASGTPTGTVTFKDGVTTICTAGIALVNGAAGCTKSDFIAGLHSITVEYSGDTNFNPSISSILNQVVGGNGSPTFLVKDINAGGPGSSPSSITGMSDGRAIFGATTAAEGAEPWVSDGTTAGTALLKDVKTGALGSSPTSFIVFSSATFFAADTTASGVELWKTDGTGTGTALLKEIRAGSASSSPSSPAVSGSLLFFSADDGTNGAELWKSDGLGSGTSLVEDINLTGSASPASLTDRAGTLFFAANDGVNGAELWKSGGLDTNTELVEDLNPLSSSSPRELLTNNGTLFFVADGASTGELWKSDGTAGGTDLVKDIRSGNGDAVTGLTTLSTGVVVFSANDGLTGNELWRSDGSALNTTRVKDINPGGDGLSGFSSTNGTAVVAGGTLYFWADDGVNGVELWKSNGIEAGTTMVVDLCPGSCSSTPLSLTASGSNIYFSAVNPITGRELWTSDGTEAGTQLVIDIEPGSGSSSPAGLKKIGNLLFFAATASSSGQELYATCTTSTTQYGVSGPPAVIGAQDSELTLRARDASSLLVPCYTGTVHFTSSDPLATLSTDYAFTTGEGLRDFDFTLRTLGSQTITATDLANPSITATLNVTVTGATTTALGSSANPSYVGGNVTFTATVTSVSAGTITGDVVFRDGAITLATVALSGGTAQFSTSSLTQGGHAMTAEYVGAGNFNGSTSPTLNQVVEAVTFGPPPNFTAFSTGTSTASMSWLPVTGATSYEVMRSTTLNGTYVSVGTTSNATLNDSGLLANQTYLYKVRSIGGPGTSGFSAVDAATTVVFTDNPITAGTTPIKAVHITQLRTAVNAIRIASGLSAFSFTDPSLASGTSIKTVHVTELRTALDPARAAIGLPVLVYTDPTITVGTTTAKRAHVVELRAGTQ